MSALYMIVGTLVALGVLVTFHEFGHFWVARRCGVKVLRFSVGFGTPLVRWHDRHGTEFVVAAIPLGGYVKMLDEREGSTGPSARTVLQSQDGPSADRHRRGWSHRQFPTGDSVLLGRRPAR